MRWRRIFDVSPYFLWASVFPMGAGLLSIDSKWPLFVLAPLFFLGGLGVWWSVAKNSPLQTMIWLGFIAAVCLTRGAALWGIDQHGVGSSYIATWTWICLAWAYLVGAYRVSKQGP